MFAASRGRAAARCGKASSTPRASPRPAELPEPDKRVPKPVIAALLLCAAELRAVARTAMAIQVVVEGGAVEQRRVGIISEMLPGCRLGSVCALAQLFSFLGSTQRGECERRPEGGVGHCGRSKVADASPPGPRLKARDIGSKA